MGGFMLSNSDTENTKISEEQYKEEMQRLNSHLDWNTKRLGVMERLVHLFGKIDDLQENLEAAVRLIGDLVDCEAGSVLLVDSEENCFFFTVAFGKNSEKLKDLTVPLGKGIVGACFDTKQVISVSEVNKDPRYYKEISDAVGFETRSLVAVPIISDGKSLGVLELLNKKDSNTFIARELQFLENIASVLGYLITLSLRVK